MFSVHDSESYWDIFKSEEMKCVVELRQQALPSRCLHLKLYVSNRFWNLHETVCRMGKAPDGCGRWPVAMTRRPARTTVTHPTTHDTLHQHTKHREHGQYSQLQAMSSENSFNRLFLSFIQHIYILISCSQHRCSPFIQVMKQFVLYRKMRGKSDDLLITKWP